MEKKSGKANRSSKRVVRDLPLSDAATPDVRGGRPQRVAFRPERVF
jgi:hypothetical protein